MTATCVISGLLGEGYEAGSKTIFPLQIKKDSPTILVDFYGKQVELAKGLQGKFATITGIPAFKEGSFSIKGNNIVETTAAASVNSFTLLGRLGRKPEIKVLPSGGTLSKSSIAIGSYVDGAKFTSWFNITCWNKAAELLADYHDKGDFVGVEGRLSLSTYQKDGKDMLGQEISCNQFFFVPIKKDGGNGTQTTPAEQKTPVAAGVTSSFDSWE